MRKIILLFFVLISLPNWAQEGRPPRGEKPKEDRVKLREKPPVEEQVKRLTLELNLNELQQLQVREILLDQEKRVVDYNPEENDGEKPSREEMETRMEMERNFLDQKMKKILTPAQSTIWTEKKANEPKGKLKEPKEFKK